MESESHRASGTFFGAIIETPGRLVAHGGLLLAEFHSARSCGTDQFPGSGGAARSRSSGCCIVGD